MAIDPLRRQRPVFRPPLFEPLEPVRETPDVSFADLVRMLAEGIADGQARLDRASADLVAELAATKVAIIPQVTETVGADGGVTYSQADAREVSLLDIGVTPTFYRFSEATVEVTMDLKLVEKIDEEGQGKRFGLFANTADVRAERKLNRDVSVSSRLTATLVPVPTPIRLEPARATAVEE